MPQPHCRLKSYKRKCQIMIIIIASNHSGQNAKAHEYWINKQNKTQNKTILACKILHNIKQNLIIPLIKGIQVQINVPRRKPSAAICEAKLCMPLKEKLQLPLVKQGFKCHLEQSLNCHLWSKTLWNKALHAT